jgi:4-aminobutyrate aminotransferase/(S)-3-amino-2-methylpropionate transaminase
MTEAARRGLILLSCGVYANVIRIMVPLTAADALVDEGLKILDDSLSAVS